ncbi:DUF642 domain-containing protein [Streptomyces sp. NBC_00059]|uniref:DUF642 domain-containing protein n=1 Tax=Streptomyces sp. NBC_00059 TaxID=2975635 RepID=UPI002258DD43|nr:DUF642 domain-containing protein [Streptomyces sp. NBC_00059]MCX5413619.1 DUF642 domain-containing protein [Streptomyces sp. NBC_00059]
MFPLRLPAASLTAAVLLLAAASTTASAHPHGTQTQGTPTQGTQTHGAQTHTIVPGLVGGGFETPVVPAPSPFTSYTGGQAVGPWTSGGHSVDLTSDRLWDAAEGSQSLDLNGSAAGGVSQEISTLPLTSYIVSFELAGNPAWAPALKTGELRVDGVPVKTFSFDITGHGFRNMGYTRHTAVFTSLLKTSVTLTFASTSPGVGGPVIDDVQVRSCLLVLCPPVS